MPLVNKFDIPNIAVAIVNIAEMYIRENSATPRYHRYTGNLDIIGVINFGYIQLTVDKELHLDKLYRSRET